MSAAASSSSSSRALVYLPDSEPWEVAVDAAVRPKAIAYLSSIQGPYNKIKAESDIAEMFIAASTHVNRNVEHVKLHAALFAARLIYNTSQRTHSLQVAIDYTVRDRDYRKGASWIMKRLTNDELRLLDEGEADAIDNALTAMHDAKADALSDPDLAAALQAGSSYASVAFKMVAVRERVRAYVAEEKARREEMMASRRDLAQSGLIDHLTTKDQDAAKHLSQFVSAYITPKNPLVIHSHPTSWVPGSSSLPVYTPESEPWEVAADAAVTPSFQEIAQAEGFINDHRMEFVAMYQKFVRDTFPLVVLPKALPSHRACLLWERLGGSGGDFGYFMATHAMQTIDFHDDGSYNEQSLVKWILRRVTTKELEQIMSVFIDMVEKHNAYRERYDSYSYGAGETRRQHSRITRRYGYLHRYIAEEKARREEMLASRRNLARSGLIDQLAVRDRDAAQHLSQFVSAAITPKQKLVIHSHPASWVPGSLPVDDSFVYQLESEPWEEEAERAVRRESHALLRERRITGGSLYERVGKVADKFMYHVGSQDNNAQLARVTMRGELFAHRMAGDFSDFGLSMYERLNGHNADIRQEYAFSWLVRRMTAAELVEVDDAMMRSAIIAKGHIKGLRFVMIRFRSIIAKEKLRRSYLERQAVAASGLLDRVAAKNGDAVADLIGQFASASITPQNKLAVRGHSTMSWKDAEARTLLAVAHSANTNDEEELEKYYVSSFEKLMSNISNPMHASRIQASAKMMIVKRRVEMGRPLIDALTLVESLLPDPKDESLNDYVLERCPAPLLDFMALAGSKLLPGLDAWKERQKLKNARFAKSRINVEQWLDAHPMPAAAASSVPARKLEETDEKDTNKKPKSGAEARARIAAKW